MVVKKRLDYGFDGYRIPVVPRAPRSLRRGSHRKSEEGSQICAFELLAAVAGKLLQESESSVSSTAAEGDEQLAILKEVIKKEQLKVKPVRPDCVDQGSYTESLFNSEFTAQDRKLKVSLKKLPNAESDSALEHASIVISSSGIVKEVDSNVKLEIPNSRNAAGNISSKHEGCSPGKRKLCDTNLENGAEKLIQAVKKPTGHSAVNVINTCSLKDHIELCVNNHVLIKSDSSVHMPFYGTSIPKASFPRRRNNVNIGIRDDDENSFRCNKLSTKIKAFRSQSNNGYRRIRKMLTSRYWKVAPKLKDCELPNTSSGMKPFYRSRKNMYMHHRFQGEAPSKRRKFWHYNSGTTYDQEASSGSIFNSPRMGAIGKKRRSSSVLHRGVTSSVIGHKSSLLSKDVHVKFSIKSFKVPELYIEVPETETVGSLKRTVMEAVTAILGSELRVGVLLQGKKVRDDNRTLQQTGISQSGDLGTLGFMLEPNFAQGSPLVQQDPPLLLSCDSHQHASRSPTSPVMDPEFSNFPLDSPPLSSLDNHAEKLPEMFSSPMDVSSDERVADSKSLVAVSAISAEALAMIPGNHKTKRSELSQRRTRRPFSVTEVEALVEAVEKLGTGRWRDVKMRAFDDANHRTYVDLKDKWKTLVHTASIAPQQRRGEPVPQLVLDRVLAAHGYWSQHQLKQHSKHQSEALHLAASEAALQMVRA